MYELSKHTEEQHVLQDGPLCRELRMIYRPTEPKLNTKFYELKNSSRYKKKETGKLIMRLC